MVDRSDDQPGWGARYDEVLDAANAHARAWLSGVSGRAVPPMIGSQEVADRLGRTLPDDGEPGAEVIERLVAAVEPGLIATGSPRFYGWVIGGTQPVALAADWLVSTWDQNAALRTITPVEPRRACGDEPRLDCGDESFDHLGSRRAVIGQRATEPVGDLVRPDHRLNCAPVHPRQPRPCMGVRGVEHLVVAGAPARLVIGSVDHDAPGFRASGAL